MMSPAAAELGSGASAKLAVALAGTGSVVVLSLPAPLCTAEVACAALDGGDGVVWDPPRGALLCGAGTTRTIEARGATRFEQVQSRARELWSELQYHPIVGARPPVRLIGGFAFDEGHADSPPWSAFGDARFVLPRLCYVRTEQEAWLCLAVAKSEITTQPARDAVLAELGRAERALAAESQRPRPERRARGALEPELPDQTVWMQSVEAIKAGIRAGNFEKIVLAHRAVVRAAELPDLAALVGRLAELAPQCARFALQRGEASFVGATPERLISKHGFELATEAVAGSIKSGGETERRKLLESSKDLREHEFVVRELLRVLTPLSRRIWHAPKPEVRELKHVAHLHTPIRAELAEDLHVLSLLRELHPTSAVGGLPRDRALAWLREHEQEPRGWYAGPFGWFDAAGNGEFHVALRSGLIAGDTAYVHAGAGIVEDSDAASEYAETQLKMAALLSALGGGS